MEPSEILIKALKELWPIALGSATIIGAFIALAAYINGKSTKKLIKEMRESVEKTIKEGNERTERLIKETGDGIKQLIKEMNENTQKLIENTQKLIVEECKLVREQISTAKTDIINILTSTQEKKPQNENKKQA